MKTNGGGSYLTNHKKNHKNLEIDSLCGFCFAKKGFTLIEIIAIIVLLSVIALITYPIIGNLINDGKDELHDKQISELERLSNTWVTRNIKKLKMEDGYTYKLTFEELNKSGLTSSSNVKDPKTGNDLPGCMIVAYNSSTKGYDVSYDSSCSGVIEKEPSINLTVDNGIINNNGYATKDFDVKVVGVNIASYKYCKGTSECEPNINVSGNNGTIKIDENGTTYVCVIGNNESKSTNKLCKSYKLDKTEFTPGTLVIDGTKGLNDWYVSDVKLSVRDVSGVISTLNISEITEDTKGTEVIMTSTNTQTGAVKTTKYTIKVDKTKPVVGELVINGTKGLNDWYTSNITFSVTNGNDTTSGHKSTTSSHTSITSDTKGTNVVVTTIDNAGNQAIETYALKVDKTVPNIEMINPTNGEWTNQDILLTVNFSDSMSGISPSTLMWKCIWDDGNELGWTATNNTSTSTYSGYWIEEGSRTAYYKICDNAGNCSTATTKVRTDKTAALLVDKIKSANPVIATDQTWTTAWQTSDPSGLYAQTVGSNKTYYFRGQPTNNYLKFAGDEYRILRVNEDGTIRIMLTDSIGVKAFNSTYNTYDKMYYTNSELKTVVDNWFTTNITGDNASKVVNGNYFCEAARVAYDGTNYKLNTGSTKLTAQESYTPTFECTTDGNGKGIVTSKVGLVTYDETINAGGWYYVRGLSYPYYLKGTSTWTMSPAGFIDNDRAYAWDVGSGGRSGGRNDSDGVDYTRDARPVLILSADTLVSGSGTSTDPYVVKS